jgi:hypothetical protein
MLKEVSLKGKSGEEYSLHGDNFDSWGTLARLRKHQLNTPNRIMTGREEDAYKRDEVNSINLMSDYAIMNNKRGRAVDRLMDIADKTSDYISKDIINNYDPKVESKQHNGNKHTVRLSESDLHRIVKESVKKVLNEESYRKSAKKGEHTSPALKHELNYQKKKGSYKPKDYHKFANKNGLNKMDVNTICDFEDARDAKKNM